MAVIKIIELVGQSRTSWEHAVKAAVREAAKTIRNITGVEVLNLTADVEDDEIVMYRANVHIAFRVEPEAD